MNVRCLIVLLVTAVVALLPSSAEARRGATDFNEEFFTAGDGSLPPDDAGNPDLAGFTAGSECVAQKTWIVCTSILDATCTAVAFKGDA